jgi:hypothetical protein
LAMAAWTYPDAGGYRPLAPMNVACSGLAISAKKEQWERLGGDNARLRAGMGRMWDLFSDAPVLGSLIDPKQDSPNPLQVARFEDLGPMLARAMEATRGDTDEYEATVAAKGLAEAAALLGGSHTLICTNVPFLVQGRQLHAMQAHCAATLPEGKGDLATAMIQRTLGLAPGGTVAVVAPQHWQYLATYASFRKMLLNRNEWRMLAALGTGAFETISGEAVNVGLYILDSRFGHKTNFVAYDLQGHPVAAAKSIALRKEPGIALDRLRQAANPGSRIMLEKGAVAAPLGTRAKHFKGICSGDYPRFGRNFWEVPLLDERWVRQHSTASTSIASAGREHAFLWENGWGSFWRFVVERLGVGGTAAWIRGREAWGKAGIAVKHTGELAASVYAGDLFDNNVTVIVPDNPADLPALWAFVESGDFEREVRKLNRKLSITDDTFAHVPFDHSRWSEAVASSDMDDVGKVVSADPTQWVFSGSAPASSNPLQVAVARLLGYHWPDQQPDALDAHADKDGIVCLPALRGERPAPDRLADLLAVAWGKDWHHQTLTDLLAAVGHQGTLEEWLRDAFFKQHCELFHHRPFIWHVWDGHREGFSALVNYHKLDHEGLKSLTYTYLGDWIRTQEIDAKAGKSGAGDKLVKAKALQQRLAAILEGEAPLDVFVRWKPLPQQPIGWHPDLDDGVRLNIRPFLTVADVGAKGAGVLRWKPNIKWGTDRGKNPPGSPWGEDRDNDKHLTLAEKRAARGEA